MKQQELLLSISKYFARFSEQVKILNKNGEFSINIHAENVLIGVLNDIYEVDLENVNYTEGKNYDTIDLRDKRGKLSIQVTATSGIKKIKNTLEGYVNNQHYKSFKELKILVLTGRQEKYNQAALDKITRSEFSFDSSRDIIDFSSIYVLLNKQNDLKKIFAIKEILESQFSDIASSVTPVKIDSFNKLCEILYPYFNENGMIFKNFGPNSGSDGIGELRWDLTLWYKARREKLLPNNAIISSLIRENIQIIPQDYEDVFEEFLSHSYAFEKHCEDKNFDYSAHQFPVVITKIVHDEISKL